jgi:hypothetical protein
VINALLLYFSAQLVKGFHVTGFRAAFFGALLISLTTLILNTVTGTGGARIDMGARRPRRPDGGAGPPGSAPPGQGPVIDV